MTKSNPFKDVTVAVIGDVMLDRYVYGDVERISPEAPVPVVKVSKQNVSLGGAGNTAINLATLGAKCICIGRLGDDRTGEELKRITEEAGIKTDMLFVDEDPTTSKTRVIARSQQVVRFDEEEKKAPSDKLRGQIKKALESAREVTDVLIIADYDKGLIDQKMLEDIKEIWGDGAMLVDPKPRFSIDYNGLSGMTPNFKETFELLNVDPVLNTDEAAVELARGLIEKFDLDHALITRSEKGMTLALADGTVHHLPTTAREVYDVSGAGDTVIATFAAGISAGMELVDAAQNANLAGGVVVGKLGTATITWDEIFKIF